MNSDKLALLLTRKIALMYELDHNDLRGLLDPLRPPGWKCRQD